MTAHKSQQPGLASAVIANALAALDRKPDPVVLIVSSERKTWLERLGYGSDCLVVSDSVGPLPDTAGQSLINAFAEMAFKSKQIAWVGRNVTVVFGSDTSEEDRSRMVAALEAKGYVVKHSVQAPSRKRFTPPARSGRLTKKQAGFGPRNRWGELG